MIKRIAAFLIALVLLVGILPQAFAEEAAGNSIPESEPIFAQPLVNTVADEYSVMALASTQTSIMLFDYADNGNYTTVLNSQVTCTYKPNGTDTTRTAYIKNLGWHFARYGGVPYADDPLYCIEPWRSYAASTSGNSVDREVTLDGIGSTTGSNVWYALPAARREAIGLILLYSNQMWDHSISVTTTKKDANPNVPLRIATQFLILRITNDGRKLALDMRLVNPLAPDSDTSKISICARNVFSIWERTQEQRSTQLVFCDSVAIRCYK